ncbi:hypothetical protein DFH06DRAFT_1132158 [Mycena polygramma]|nr:hypothetical protein DFH06DRAFT_1132158 [Mycena polygramma]
MVLNSITTATAKWVHRRRTKIIRPTGSRASPTGKPQANQFVSSCPGGIQFDLESAPSSRARHALCNGLGFVAGGRKVSAGLDWSPNKLWQDWSPEKFGADDMATEAAGRSCGCTTLYSIASWLPILVSSGNGTSRIAIRPPRMREPTPRMIRGSDVPFTRPTQWQDRTSRTIGRRGQESGSGKQDRLKGRVRRAKQITSNQWTCGRRAARRTQTSVARDKTRASERVDKEADAFGKQSKANHEKEGLRRVARVGERKLPAMGYFAWSRSENSDTDAEMNLLQGNRLAREWEVNLEGASGRTNVPLAAHRISIE